MDRTLMTALLIVLMSASSMGCVGAVGSLEGAPASGTEAPEAPAGPVRGAADGRALSVPWAEGPSAATRTSDAAPPPPVGTSTTVRGCPDGLVHCDDFEGGTIDGALWETTVRDGSTIAVEDGALRLAITTVDGSRALLSPRGLFPGMGERFWGRFYFRTDADIEMVHSYVFNAVGTLDGARAYYGLHSNSRRLNSRYVAAHVEEHGGWKKFGTHRLPTDWTCVEFEFDTARGAISFFFDGEEDVGMRVDETSVPPWTGPELTGLDIGFHTYQAAAAPFVVWYDGVAFDTERVGCD